MNSIEIYSQIEAGFMHNSPSSTSWSSVRMRIMLGLRSLSVDTGGRNALSGESGYEEAPDVPPEFPLFFTRLPPWDAVRTPRCLARPWRVSLDSAPICTIGTRPTMAKTRIVANLRVIVAKCHFHFDNLPCYSPLSHQLRGGFVASAGGWWHKKVFLRTHTNSNAFSSRLAKWGQ